mgnify:CR=1 FL=1
MGVRRSRNRLWVVSVCTVLSALLLTPAATVYGQSAQQLKNEVSRLEKQLRMTQQQLEQAKQREAEARAELEQVETKVAEAEAPAPSKIEIGPLQIGGAIRANYTIGDYSPKLDRPSRNDEDGGTFALDTFRINLDYSQGPWVGKAEYRFYPGYGTNNHDGYHFLHTGWFGYNFEDDSQVQVGVNRVPFGPGPYGVSQSWMFDQHYYVGLSDDMDLGIKYVKPCGNMTLDLAYYVQDEGSYYGENFSDDSARYSYDVVDETGSGYEEEHQFNVRAIWSVGTEAMPTDVGFSAQYGMLESNGAQDDGDHYAGSAHMVNKWDNWTLASQLTYYEYDVDDAQPLGTDDLVQFGAYDFPTLVAAEAWIPAISLSYYYETPNLPWLDYVIPYAEYSSIVKSDSDFNNSEMFVLGAAWGRGGWYIYTDLALSDGNDFVGNEAGYGANPAPGFSSNRFGANPTDEWEYRFNINFGYYF